MLIQLRTRLATSTNNYAPGSIVDLPEAQANDLIAKGYAIAGEVGATAVTFSGSEGVPEVRQAILHAPGDSVTRVEYVGEPRVEPAKAKVIMPAAAKLVAKPSFKEANTPTPTSSTSPTPTK